MQNHHVPLAVLALTLASTLARAADLKEKEACVAAADQGQQLRDDGKYRQAHEAFMQCARPSCPKLVRGDCGGWLLDLEQRASTVVVGARDSTGKDLVQVKVTLDGEPLTETLDGKPMPVDPGEHVFRYEAPGFPAVDQRIVIKAGEKNRVLNVRFSAPKQARVSSLERGAVPARDVDPAPRRTRSIPLPTWVFGGTAIAAFGSATYFGLRGVAERSDDLGSSGCAPDCPASEKSSIRTKFLAADISLGVGLVSAGLATYFYLRPRESSPGPAATAIGFAPHDSGGVASVIGHF
jgi:hypothetical protein